MKILIGVLVIVFNSSNQNLTHCQNEILQDTWIGDTGVIIGIFTDLWKKPIGLCGLMFKSINLVWTMITNVGVNTQLQIDTT